MLWAAIFCSSPVQADAYFDVSAEQGSIRLADTLSWFRDSSADLTLADIQSRNDFQPVPAAGMNFGYTQDVIWLKIPLHATDTGMQSWVLEFEFAYLDDIRLYVVRSDQKGMNAEEMQAGNLYPLQQWSMAARKPVFPLLLQPDEKLTLYVRAENSAALALNMRLATAHNYYLTSSVELIFLALYFGMLVALGSYNFLLYLNIRQNEFLLYSGFVFAFGLAASHMNGLAPLLLWQRDIVTSPYYVSTGFSLAQALAIMFARRFLWMKNAAPGWHRFLTLMIPVWWLGTLITLLVSPQQALKIMSVMGFLTTIFLLSAGIVAMQKRVPAAWIFVLAWCLLLVGTSMLAIRNTGMLPSNLMTVFGMQIGSAIEMLLLSFALAARFNDMKRQKEKAQQSLLNTLMLQERVLEERVYKRTAELEETKAQLEQLVICDPLTGLYNRHGLRHYFAQMMKRAHRQHQPLIVALIDLDEFKPVNDHYGHEVGDEVLTIIAGRLQANLRESDGIGRLGGDEFVVLSEATASDNDLDELGRRILAAVTEPMNVRTTENIRVRASIGICHSYVEGQTLKSLLRRADAAMYQIKHNGKNGVAIDSSVSPDDPASGSPVAV